MIEYLSGHHDFISACALDEILNAGFDRFRRTDHTA